MPESWKQWVRIINGDTHALYLAARDPRVPLGMRKLAISVAAYALFPINLIPDFVPVLGNVDDLIIVPAGIALVIRLIPPEIVAQHRDMAIAAQDRPVSRAAAVAIVLGNFPWWPRSCVLPDRGELRQLRSGVVS